MSSSWRDRHSALDSTEVRRRLKELTAARKPKIRARKARAFLESITAQSYPEYWAIALVDLANSLTREGQDTELSEARDALLDARAQSESSADDLWAEIMIDLGHRFYKSADGQPAQNFDVALTCYEDVIDWLGANVSRELSIDAHLSSAELLTIRRTSDRGADSEAALRHLEICEELVGEPPSKLHSQIYYTYGVAYDARLNGDRKTNIGKAIEYFMKAYSSYGEDEPLLRGRSARSLGMAHINRSEVTVGGNDLEEAEKYILESMRLRPKTTHPYEWAISAEMLVKVRLYKHPGEVALGFITSQIDLLDQAAEIHHTLAEPGREDNKILLTLVLRKAEESGLDLGHQTKLLALRRLFESLSHNAQPGIAGDVGLRLGGLLADAGRWAEAADVLERASLTSEQMLIAALTRVGREEHQSTAASIARMHSYALARLGRFEDAVVALEQGRTRMTEELGGVREESLLLDLEGLDQRLVDEYRRARDQLRYIRDRDLSGAIQKRRPSASRDSAEVTSVELTATAEMTRELRRRLKDLVQRIRYHEGFSEFLRPADFSTVEAAVQQGFPLVYLNVTKWGSVALIVSKTESSSSVDALWANDFTEDDIDRIILRPTNPLPSAPWMSHGFLMRQTTMVATLHKDGSAILYEDGRFVPGAVDYRSGRDEDGGIWVLGEKIAAPLAEELGRRRETDIALILCGRLGELPVHTAGHHSGPDAPCLLHTVDVAIVPSARALTKARVQVGRCKYPISSKFVGAANPMPHPNPLPFAVLELERVGRMFTRKRKLLKNRRATKERFLSISRSAEYVHLACHGTYSDRDHSPRLQFELGAEISVIDILRERPFSAARLVTLSTCQSAVPSHYSSIDEVDGLPSAIMSTGAAAVLATLWPVDDLSTALLIERFYHLHLRGEPRMGYAPLAPHRALSSAQRWLASLTAGELREYLDSRPDIRSSINRSESGPRYPAAEMAKNLTAAPVNPNQRPFSDPWFWGAFVLIGI